MLLRTLKAPEEIAMQLALLPSELRRVFAAAPPLMCGLGSDLTDGYRKPLDEECPICLENVIEPGAAEPSEPLVFCMAVCGNSMHLKCFAEWAEAKLATIDSVVPCPICRCEWQFDKRLGKDDVKRIVRQAGRDNGNHYVNIAYELGLSEREGELSFFFALLGECCKQIGDEA